jgi:creatinine amidohydrolase
MGTDNSIALEIAERSAAALGGLVFPVLPLGNINLVYDFRYLPGTISIDSDILIRLYTNIGTELARSGFKRQIFVNGHSCNSPILAIASFEIRERSGAEVGVLDWWTSAPEIVEDIKGFNFASHADEIETSVLLATADRELVNLDKAEKNSRTLDHLSEDELLLYKIKMPFTRTLDARWIGTAGNMGDPTRATEAHGNRIIEKTVQMAGKLANVLAEQLDRTPGKKVSL